MPALELIKSPQSRRNMVLGMGSRWAEGVAFNTWAVFAIAYGTGTLHLSRQTLLLAVMAAAATMIVFIPVFGKLADRYDRRHMFAAGSVILTAAAYPAFVLIGTGDTAVIVITIVLVLGVLYPIVYAPESSLFAELFPTRVRYSGISVVYQLSGIVASGLTPLVLASLLGSASGGLSLIMGYIVAVGAVSTLCTLAIRRRDLYTEDQDAVHTLTTPPCRTHPRPDTKAAVAPPRSYRERGLGLPQRHLHEDGGAEEAEQPQHALADLVGGGAVEHPFPRGGAEHAERCEQGDLCEDGQREEAAGGRARCSEGVDDEEEHDERGASGGDVGGRGEVHENGGRAAEGEAAVEESGRMPVAAVTPGPGSDCRSGTAAMATADPMMATPSSTRTRSPDSCVSAHMPTGIPIRVPANNQRNDFQCTCRHTCGSIAALATTSRTNTVGITDVGGSRTTSPATHTMAPPKPPKPRTTPPATTMPRAKRRAGSDRSHTVAAIPCCTASVRRGLRQKCGVAAVKRQIQTASNRRYQDRTGRGPRRDRRRPRARHSGTTRSPCTCRAGARAWTARRGGRGRRVRGCT